MLGWLAGSALCGAAVFCAVTRWRQLAWNAAPRPRLHWAGAGISVGCALALAVGIAVTG